MDHFQVYLIIATIFGLCMTWGVGANDLANVMSPTMGSKAITVRQAIFIAIIFEFAGALLGGSDVSSTMRSGIINLDSLNDTPIVLVWGMLSVLIASTIWINFAAYMGVPVSITNAIVGSFVGFGSIVLGVQAIHWQQVGFIAASWFTAPTIAGFFAYLLFSSIQYFILSRKDILKCAQRSMPYYLLMIGIVLAFITLINGFAHFHLDVKTSHQWLLMLISALIIAWIGWYIMPHQPDSTLLRRQERFAYVERQFAILTALATCAMIFAHGSNDVAVAVGPIMVILAVGQDAGHMNTLQAFPLWIILFGCTGVVAGLVMYGRKVIETVGSGITALTPSRAFAATLAAASTVVVSTSTGIPLSATQTLVGAVLGVGLARGIGALNLVVIRNIILSWIITIPVASILTIGIFYMIRQIAT